MFYQMKEVIDIYLKEETITRLTIREAIVIPRITILLEKSVIKENVYKLWENNTHNINYINLKELNQFLSLKNILKFCKIIINKIEIICPKPTILYSYRTLSLVIMFFGNMNSSYIEMLRNYKIDKYFNRISVELSTNITQHKIFNLILGHSFADLKSYLSIYFIKNNITNIFFNSYSIQKLKTKSYLCNPFLNNKLISNIDNIEFCKSNCLFDMCYERYKCLLKKHFEFIISFNYLLESKNTKICTNADNNFSDSYFRNYYIFKEICKKKCIKECNQMYFSIKAKTNYIYNSTQINIIPISSHHFRYEETIICDFNELIYKLGGIIGLWFGLYSVSFVYFIELLYKELKKWKQISNSIKSNFINLFEIIIKQFLMNFMKNKIIVLIKNISNKMYIIVMLVKKIILVLYKLVIYIFLKIMFVCVLVIYIFKKIFSYLPQP